MKYMLWPILAMLFIGHAIADTVVTVQTDAVVIASGTILPKDGSVYEITVVEDGDCCKLCIGDSLFAKYCPPIITHSEEYGNNWRPRVSTHAREVALTYPHEQQFTVFCDTLLAGLKKHNLIQGEAEIDNHCQTVGWLDPEGVPDNVTFKSYPYKSPRSRALEDQEHLSKMLDDGIAVIFGPDYRVYIKGESLAKTLLVFDDVRAGRQVDTTGTAFSAFHGGAKFFRDVTGR